MAIVYSCSMWHAWTSSFQVTRHIRLPSILCPIIHMRKPSFEMLVIRISVLTVCLKIQMIVLVLSVRGERLQILLFQIEF